MKCVSRPGLRVNIPELYAVNAADIHEHVLVFEEKPGLCESWEGKRHIWLLKDRCKELCCETFRLYFIMVLTSQWYQTGNICLH
jgi:hypothetical protein